MSRHTASTVFRKTAFGKYVLKLKRKQWLVYKQLYWRICSRQDEKKIIFIVGYQRSGTSILSQVFEQDLNVAVFQEDSSITGQDASRLRLRPYGEVNRIFSLARQPIIVAKPLVESQHTLELMANFSDSWAVWAFRRYKDVANSDVRRFHRQIPNLGAIVDAEPNNWRTEGVSKETRSIVSNFFSTKMSRADAAALMWYARNVLFFENRLDTHPRVWMWKYEDFVESPNAAMRELYSALELEYPRRNIVREVDSRSLGLGSDIELHPDIDHLCTDLQDRLDACYRQQGQHVSEHADLDHGAGHPAPSRSAS